MQAPRTSIAGLLQPRSSGVEGAHGKGGPVQKVSYKEHGRSFRVHCKNHYLNGKGAWRLPPGEGVVDKEGGLPWWVSATARAGLEVRLCELWVASC